MGLFSGRVIGDAVTYVGHYPGLLGAVERPHGLRLDHGGNGIVVARHDYVLRPSTYDVKFGDKVVRGVPASELVTDRWGMTLGTGRNRNSVNGSHGGSVPIGMLDNPIGELLGGCLLALVGFVLAVYAVVAGLGLGGSDGVGVALRWPYTVH